MRSRLQSSGRERLLRARAGERLLRARAQAAVGAGAAVSQLSRRLGRGSGGVVGGRVSLALDPGLLASLAVGHRLALVSGTNGKTTTTRLLAAALSSAGPALTNVGGANLPAGLVPALATATPGCPGALEVDEAWLGHVAAAVDPEAVALLNLSRDQLDRVSEVRRLASRWREVVAAHPGVHVVANADDPIVTWAALPAPRVTWVAAGQPWRLDASACPACEAGLVFSGDRWWCPSCGLARPRPDAWLEEGDGRPATDGGFRPAMADGRRSSVLALADGRRFPLPLALPGRFNRANAAVAAVTAGALGLDVAQASGAMAEVTDVSGRYQLVAVGHRDAPKGLRARLLLAKNPAGWVELFDLLAPAPAPVVLAINARVADGRDPSWLWDVPFERLAARRAVVTGERRLDLAVRLRYAEVGHVVVAHPIEALVRAGAMAGGERTSPSPALPVPGGEEPTVDFVGNYTAFQDVRRHLTRAGA